MGEDKRMSGYGHEAVVKIKKVERLQKQYKKPVFILIGITFILMIIMIYSETASEQVDEISGFPLSRVIGYIMVVPLLIIGFRPTWFRIGEVLYFKTVITDKWDYEQYTKAIGWRKWFNF